MEGGGRALHHAATVTNDCIIHIHTLNSNSFSVYYVDVLSLICGCLALGFYGGHTLIYFVRPLLLHATPLIYALYVYGVL